MNVAVVKGIILPVFGVLFRQFNGCVVILNVIGSVGVIRPIGVVAGHEHNRNRRNIAAHMGKHLCPKRFLVAVLHHVAGV